MKKVFGGSPQTLKHFGFFLSPSFSLTCANWLLTFYIYFSFPSKGAIVTLPISVLFCWLSNAAASFDLHSYHGIFKLIILISTLPVPLRIFAATSSFLHFYSNLTLHCLSFLMHFWNFPLSAFLCYWGKERSANVISSSGIKLLLCILLFPKKLSTYLAFFLLKLLLLAWRILVSCS